MGWGTGTQIARPCPKTLQVYPCGFDTTSKKAICLTSVLPFCSIVQTFPEALHYDLKGGDLYIVHCQNFLKGVRSLSPLTWPRPWIVRVQHRNIHADVTIYLWYAFFFYFKLTGKVIYHWKRQPYFLANLFLTQGIGSEYVHLISFTWAYSGCKERKPIITKWKTAHSGTRTHDPWITSVVYFPSGHQLWLTNDKLKLN